MAIQDHMGSFIVRMYGDVTAGDESFVGIAQDIDSGGAYPFKGPGDLWAILTAEQAGARPKADQAAGGSDGNSSAEGNA